MLPVPVNCDYDPVIGRFYSNDPVGFSATNPMLFNRYLYANNNPYGYTDPDGAAAISIEAEAEGKIGGIVIWALEKATGKEVLAGGLQGSVGVAISFPLFDGGKFDAGLVASGAMTDVRSGGSPLPSLPGAKGGATLSLSKGSVSDLAGTSYAVNAQANIGKQLTKKLTSVLPASIRNHVNNGLSAAAGLVVSGGLSFDENGISGVQVGAAKGLNLGISAGISKTAVCSIRDGCSTGGSAE